MRSGNAGGDFEGGSKSVRRLVREEEEEKAHLRRHKCPAFTRKIRDWRRPDPENLEVKDKFKDTAIQYLYLDHQVVLILSSRSIDRCSP